MPQQKQRSRKGSKSNLPLSHSACSRVTPKQARYLLSDIENQWSTQQWNIRHHQHHRPPIYALLRRYQTNRFPCRCWPHLHLPHAHLHDILWLRNRPLLLCAGTATNMQKDYFLGYYFWLDLISTLTMAFDLVWITQYLTGGGKNAANISQISRASRAARLGTRTVKLLRLIRMIKIIRQMKTLSSDIAQNQKSKKPKKSQRISKM